MRSLVLQLYPPKSPVMLAKNCAALAFSPDHPVKLLVGGFYNFSFPYFNSFLPKRHVLAVRVMWKVAFIRIRYADYDYLLLGFLFPSFLVSAESA